MTFFVNFYNCHRFCCCISSGEQLNAINSICSYTVVKYLSCSLYKWK